MPINPDIRWKQRLTNFERSVQLLQQSLIIPNPDIITRAAIIQFFEVTMELAWKTLKDYLEAQKFIEINSPKSVIKKAFETGLIKDGHGWMHWKIGISQYILMTKIKQETSNVLSGTTISLIEQLIDFIKKQNP